MRKSKVLSVVLASAFVVSTAVTAVPNVASAVTDPSKESVTEGKKPFDENGTYHAYVQFQADTCWVFRNPYYDKNYGRTYKDFNSVLQSVDDKIKKVDGTITDAEIKGNGTYTVSIKGLNGIVPNDGTCKVTMVGVSTDIPKNDKVKITNVRTKVDGSTKLTQDTAIIDDEALESPKTLMVACTNTYRASAALKKELQIPRDSVEVTFTISGFAKDNPDAVEATKAPLKIGKAKKRSKVNSDSSVPVVPIAIAGVAVVVIIAGVVVFRKKK